MVRNIELEKQIDEYIKGNLTEEQAQELWEKLFQNPEYIELLNTDLGVRSIVQEQGNELSKEEGRHAMIYSLQNSWKWVAGVAAVVLIAVAINFFGSVETSLEQLSIQKINVSENLASAPTMRSVQQHTPSDSLLNLGFKKAISGNVDKAVAIYDLIIREHPNEPASTQAYLNKGIIQFNDQDFEGAIASFKAVTRKAKKQSFTREKGYWYLGNAFINTDSLSKAHQAMEQVYLMEGIYHKPAIDLLKELDEQLGHDEREYDF
jgi:tetratricopeptide (TPR) repeat protein